MNIEDIVSFWREQQAEDDKGRWSHKLDRKALDAATHTFNLDHPISPYIGDVLAAPVIILNANAGYSASLTPTEFPDADAIEAYTVRVDDPSGSDWSFVSRYYDRTNYGDLVASRKAVVVNACAYRSPKISEEPDNQRIIPKLPSSIFTRRWLLEAIMPLAARGERLIINNRGMHWRLGASADAPGVVRDPCPASPLITGAALSAIKGFLAECP